MIELLNKFLAYAIRCFELGGKIFIIFSAIRFIANDGLKYVSHPAVCLIFSLCLIGMCVDGIRKDIVKNKH